MPPTCSSTGRRQRHEAGARRVLLAVMAAGARRVRVRAADRPARPLWRRRACTSCRDSSPSAGIRAGVPVTLSFTVAQPSGAPLVHYRTGPGPHTGVHLILVRDDLATIIHRHPPIAANGLHQRAGRVPEAGAVPRARRRLPADEGAGVHELPALPHDRRRGRLPPAAAAALQARGHDGRLAVHHQAAADPAPRPGGADRRDRPRRRRTAGGLHALVRRDGPRDLLPRARPGLLPHPHLRAQAGRAARAWRGRPRSRAARRSPG